MIERIISLLELKHSRAQSDEEREALKEAAGRMLSRWDMLESADSDE